MFSMMMVRVQIYKETACKYFYEFMWGTRYAKTITVEEAIRMMK